ncbi:CPBP family intramembrane glutamic endopeptidase [Lachnospiraceae bacterium 46-15]
MKEAANTGKRKTLLISAGIEIMLITCITAANLNPIPILYFIFYNLLYGLVFSFLIPLYCLYKETPFGPPFMPSSNNKGNGASVSGGMLAEAGLKKPGIQQWAVLSVFVAFSIGGQLIPKMAAGEQVPWHLLPMGIVPLIMTTFFEEFLFRGFVQSRIDRQFGWIPAILVSGAMFSLYHLGYPGFRIWEDLLLLFAVGIGFAAAYKLSDNNLIISFFVNLPNAFVTYILKYEQFPVMCVSSAIAAAITLVLIGLILLL